MQNNPRKQDIIQELRDKSQDVTELCTEAETVNEPHTGRYCYGLSLSECA